MGIALIFCNLLDPDRQALIFVNNLDRNGKSRAADGQQTEQRQPEPAPDEAARAALWVCCHIHAEEPPSGLHIEFASKLSRYRGRDDRGFGRRRLNEL